MKTSCGSRSRTRSTVTRRCARASAAAAASRCRSRSSRRAAPWSGAGSISPGVTRLACGTCCKRSPRRPSMWRTARCCARPSPLCGTARAAWCSPCPRSRPTPAACRTSPRRSPPPMRRAWKARASTGPTSSCSTCSSPSGRTTCWRRTKARRTAGPTGRRSPRVCRSLCACPWRPRATAYPTRRGRLPPPSTTPWPQTWRPGPGSSARPLPSFSWPRGRPCSPARRAARTSLSPPPWTTAATRTSRGCSAPWPRRSRCAAGWSLRRASPSSCAGPGSRCSTPRTGWSSSRPTRRPGPAPTSASRPTNGPRLPKPAVCGSRCSLSLIAARGRSSCSPASKQAGIGSPLSISIPRSSPAPRRSASPDGLLPCSRAPCDSPRCRSNGSRSSQSASCGSCSAASTRRRRPSLKTAASTSSSRSRQRGRPPARPSAAATAASPTRSWTRAPTGSPASCAPADWGATTGSRSASSARPRW